MLNENFLNLLELFSVLGSIDSIRRLKYIVYILKQSGLDFPEKFSHNHTGVYSVQLNLEIEDVVNVMKADEYGRLNYRVNEKDFKELKLLYEGMFKEITGKVIDLRRYKGEKIGEQIYLKRCEWIKKQRNELNSKWKLPEERVF